MLREILQKYFFFLQINHIVEKYNAFQSEQKGGQGYFILVQIDTRLVITSLENTDFYLQSGKKVI